jgi:DNA-binding PadR family transcriptional regulator
VAISGRYNDELPKLTPTGWTVLGFLSICPRNGYQVHQAVQRSVGHFWGVSYGQLYPQLKVLQEQGFITPSDATTDGGRQTSWQLTERGAEVLDRWLRIEPAPPQRRDEGMVKLMFADHAGPDAMLSLIQQRRTEAGRRRDLAEAVIPDPHGPDQASRGPNAVLATSLVRAHTLALANAELAWCDQAETMLAEQGQMS